MLLQEKQLVEQNLDLIPKAIACFITTHRNIPGMEYDDLYQTGCLALCDAARSYHPEKKARFDTYAMVVIRNRLYDYCRHINHVQSHTLYLDASLPDQKDVHFVDCVASSLPDMDASEPISSLLLTIGEGYGGIAAKGVKALLLKTYGYSGKEIARLYHVNPNHVAAWVSRAVRKLRQEPCLLSRLQS